MATASPIGASAAATHRSLYLLVAYVAAFLVLANTFTEWEQMRRAAAVLVVSAFAMTVFALVQKFSGTDAIYWFHKPRFGGAIFGPFTNRNHFAAHINMALGVALGLLLTMTRAPEEEALPTWRRRLSWLLSNRGSRIALLGFAALLMAAPGPRLFAIGLAVGLAAIAMHSALDYSLHRPANALFLAAGACLFVSITMFLVSLMFGQTLCMVLMACLSGAILGFLLFNFHPASIFLGDSGSMLLGLLVGALCLLGTSKATATGAQLIPVIALGLPLLDTTLAILRRWSRKLPVSAADRHHVHHVLLSMGVSHRRAVLFLYLASVSLGGAAMLMTVERAEVTLVVAGSLGVAAFACARMLGAPRLAELWGRVSEELARRQQAAAARAAVARATARMRTAPSTQALWQESTDVIRSLELDFAMLRLYDGLSSRPVVLAWPGPAVEAKSHLALEPDAWSARLSVRPNGSAFGEIEVGKAVGGSALPAYAPELLDSARTEMATQIGRLRVRRPVAAVEEAPRRRRPELVGAGEGLAGVGFAVAVPVEWDGGTPIGVG